jgi:hypothetical protein
MKKHIHILAIIAALSLCLTACTEPKNDEQNSEVQTFNQITSNEESQTTTTVKKAAEALTTELTEIAADVADVTTSVDSQTEPYQEEWSDTEIYRETEVFIAHTEPVPGDSGNVDIPQTTADSHTEPYQEELSDTDVYRETEVFIAHTEPIPGDENVVIDIPQN